MGLDVYLYKWIGAKTPEQMREIEEKVGEEAEAILEAELKKRYPQYESAPDSAKREFSNDLYKKLGSEKYEELIGKKQKELYDKAGLDEYGGIGGDNESRVGGEDDLNSAKYPKHYFKKNYLRSSYNDTGINNILRNSIGKDLYYIFFGEGQGDGYRVFPDWVKVHERALEVLELWKKNLAETGDLRVLRSHINPFIGADQISQLANSPERALDIAKEEVRRHRAQLNNPKVRPELKDKVKWYSNLTGEFFMGDPIKVVAILPGVQASMRGKLTGHADAIEPATYIVWKAEDKSEDSNGENWYTAALEIVIEMCEHVLAQPDPEKYLVHWSG